MDFVKELRHERRFYEAEQLVMAFRRDVKKTGRDESSNQKRIEARIRKSKGMCVTIGCIHKAKERRIKCVKCCVTSERYYKRHSKKIIKYQKEYRKKKKLTRLKQ